MSNEGDTTCAKSDSLSHGERMICDGDYVIIRRTHDKDSVRLVKVERGKCTYLGKQRINLNGFIGQPFDSTFEVNKNRELILVDDPLSSNSILNANRIDDADDDPNKDNRFLVDDGRSQKLSKDEIETLKSEGLTGKEIIENLVDNSTTFKEKTSFAQEKYLKKKQQKYSTYMTVMKPNLRILTEMYYSQGPQKIDNLRIDSLAQMLSLCNVMSGGRYIVVDSNLGLLTAAVLERIGGAGSVIQVYADPGPVTTYRQAVEAVNVPEDILNATLFGLKLSTAHKLAKNEIESTDKQCETQTVPKREGGDYDRDKDKRRAQRQIEEQKAISILQEKNMDGLLMIVKSYDPINILELLLQFLGNSRPFAIFCQFIDPLISCFAALKNKSVHVRLTETWMRKYQVLPDRTRPDMQMSGSGGYLLSGIKVLPD